MFNNHKRNQMRNTTVTDMFCGYVKFSQNGYIKTIVVHVINNTIIIHTIQY